VRLQIARSEREGGLMGTNYLVGLVSEWYEYQGFLVHRNVSVKNAAGNGSMDLDVIAMHPAQNQFVHVEASMDSDSWQKREQRFRRKFRAGGMYIDGLASGMKKKPEVRQIALLVYARKARRKTLGGGELILMPQFLYEIIEVLAHRRVEKQIVPEHLPLLRTLQFVTEYREDLFLRDSLF